MNLIINKFFLFLILFLLFDQKLFSRNLDLKIADSLFYKEEYIECKKYYDSLFFDLNLYTESMLLKMAFIEEKYDNYEKAIYFLSIYEKNNNDDRVKKRLDKIISSNNLSSFELDEYDYILNIFSKKRNEIIMFFLSLIILIFSINIFMLIKKRKANFLIIPFYILSFLQIIFLNFNFPNYGIVSNDNTFIMDHPSSGSDIFTLINKGEKVKMVNEIDPWYEIIINDRKKYIRKKNIYLID